MTQLVQVVLHWNSHHMGLQPSRRLVHCHERLLLGRHHLALCLRSIGSLECAIVQRCSGEGLSSTFGILGAGLGWKRSFCRQLSTCQRASTTVSTTPHPCIVTTPKPPETRLTRNDQVQHLLQGPVVVDLVDMSYIAFSTSGRSSLLPSNRMQQEAWKENH